MMRSRFWRPWRPSRELSPAPPSPPLPALFAAALPTLLLGLLLLLLLRRRRPSTAASAAVAALDEAAVHAARAEAEAHGWALSRECDAGTDAHLQVYTRVVRERPGEAGRAAADSCEYEIRLVAEAPHGAAEVFALFAEADLLPSWNPLAAEGGFLDLQTRGGADGVLSAKALCRLRMPPLPSLLLHYSVVVEDRFADAAEGCLYARAASEHADTGAALPAWARKVRKLPFGGAECRFTPLPPRNEGGARTRLDVRITLDLASFPAKRFSPKRLLDTALYYATPWAWKAARLVLERLLRGGSPISKRLAEDDAAVYRLVREATRQPPPQWLAPILEAEAAGTPPPAAPPPSVAGSRGSGRGSRSGSGSAKSRAAVERARRGGRQMAVSVMSSW